MKKTFMSTLVILGALAATDALAQGPAYVDQYGREFRPPSETDRAPRAARPHRPVDRGALGAHAQRRVVSPAAFDGAWSVAINTRSGGCDPSYRFGLQIVDGNVVYEGRAAGRVTPNGAVRVSIAQGDQRANGQGQLSRSYGSGVWRGSGSAGACAGTWQAVRRGY